MQIPEQHLNEFYQRQARLIKNRLQLFCILAVGIYLLIDLISLVIYPEEFKSDEIPVILLLIAGGLIILYINKKVRTLTAAKLNTYLFTAFLLALLTNVSIIYYEYARESATIYLFVLFLVSLTMPLITAEVILITLMHAAAYSFYFLHIQNYMPEHIKTDFNTQVFFDGLIILAMAFIICLAARKKETAREIENFVLLKEVEEKNAQMQRELELATRVHKTLIPKSMSTDLVDVAVLYLPMYYIGGDYAKFHFIDKDRLLFIICDVTGHGVSAALLVNRLHAEFERLANEGKEPGTLLKELNEFIVKDFAGINMYLSAFSCMLDFKAMKFSYSNHGHPAQYLYQTVRSDVQSLNSQTTLLGISFKAEEPPQQNEISFNKGDRLSLFTDGVIETMNKEGEEYGQKNLESFIKKNCDLKVDLFNQKLLDELNAFKAGGFKDDVFMLNIQVK